MATLEARLKAALTAVATDIKTLTVNQGSLAALTTSAKTNLVAALNELKSAIDGVSAASGAQIDDSATSTNTIWSSTKVNSAIGQAINALLNGAPTAFDTLKELADQLAADQGALTSIVTALGKRLRFDSAQGLTSAEIIQATANLGLGDIDADLAAHYAAAKA